MNVPPTLPVEQLKREAKRIHRQEGITHSAALNRIAQRYGFNNWSLLMKQHNKQGVTA